MKMKERGDVEGTQFKELTEAYGKESKPKGGLAGLEQSQEGNNTKLADVRNKGVLSTKILVFQHFFPFSF